VALGSTISSSNVSTLHEVWTFKLSGTAALGRLMPARSRRSQTSTGAETRAATISSDLVFTTLYSGVLLALNRRSGAIVYQHTLPTSTNAPIAIAGNTVLSAGNPSTSDSTTPDPQLVACSTG